MKISAFLRLGLFALVSSCVALQPASLLAREPVKEEPKGYATGIVVKPMLITSTTVDGQPIVYPKTENPEVRIVKVTIPPGVETGWHFHPTPAYGVVLSGSITVELENGESNTFTAGSALAEVVNVVHNGRNNGTEPVELIMVITGEKDQPSTIAKERAAQPAKAE